MKRSHASAPGKVILFGEHGVVYGTLAIAASVSDLRVHVEVIERQDDLIVIDLPNLKAGHEDLSSTFSIDQSKALDTLKGVPCSNNGSNGNHHVAAAKTTAAGGDEESRAKVEAIHASNVSCPCSTSIASKEVRNPCPATATILSNLIMNYPETSRKAYMAILFLWVSILGKTRRDNDHGVTIQASTSTLPIGAGLGSSAALAVAVSAALLRFKYIRQGEYERAGCPCSPSSSSSSIKKDDKSTDTATSLTASRVGRGIVPPFETAQVINRWAFAAETLLHGHPSGLDNTVGCFGSAVQFRRSNSPPPSPPPSSAADGKGSQQVAQKSADEFLTVHDFPPLRVLLTNTCMPRETKVLVAHVRQLKKRLPGPTSAVMNAMEAVSQEFLSLIDQYHEEEKEGEEDDAEHGIGVGRRERMGRKRKEFVALTSELIDMAHSLLNGLGVGHAKLDVICRETSQYGYSSKLTGAGGGGCALTLLDVEEEGEEADLKDAASSQGRIQSMMETLEKKHGFQCFMTTLGGVGCLWHDEACEKS